MTLLMFGWRSIQASASWLIEQPRRSAIGRRFCTRVSVACDGEVTIMEPPLHYRVRPQALRVLAPAGTQTRGEVDRALNRPPV